MTSINQNKLLQQLRTALSAGTIPLDMHERASAMLARLQSPVRLVIIGPSGSGKSAMLNFLARQEIVPAGVDWPSVALSWGETMHTSIAQQDEQADEEPALLNVTAPLPFLKTVSVLEVASGDTPDLTPDRVAWAVKRADILLWCSQEFNDVQRDLWATVPEGLKDHSFFVLTKADLLSEKDELATRIEQLQDVVAEEFHSMVPIATLQAISATGPDGKVDTAVLAASGGKALMAAITHHVDLGRQSERDNVQLFLKQCKLDLPVEQPAPVETAEPGLAGQALGYLGGRAETLTGFDVDNSTEILDFCVQTADHLTEMLLDGPQDDDQMAVIRDDVMQTADTMLLMQIESGVGPAADAVTLLIQLHRDVQAAVAA